MISTINLPNFIFTLLFGLILGAFLGGLWSDKSLSLLVTIQSYLFLRFKNINDNKINENLINNNDNNSLNSLKKSVSSSSDDLTDADSSSVSSTSTTSSISSTTSSNISTNIKIPRHIAVVMDGNRRYAKKNGLTNSIQGHWLGGERLVDFIQWCMEENVEILTMFAFSSENWNRSKDEIDALMNLFMNYIDKLKKESLKNNIKIKFFVTKKESLPINVYKSIKELEEISMNCNKITVNICMSYGGRGDIVNSCKNICNKVLNNEINIDDIDESLFSKHLETSNCLDPDILIRTSGEYRISNFLLWQLAYSELFFINKLWPEITQNDLKNVIKDYNERSRRYGK